MKDRIKRVQAGLPEQIESAMRAEGEIELAEAKRRTPVWNPANRVPPGHTPGSLRASGKVMTERSRGEVIVVFSFGDELVDYAIYVHEDLEAFHATGQAKFLQSVLEESAPYFMERVGVRINLGKDLS
jgi:hypothetical protein